MTRRLVERSISTTANIYLADNHGQEFAKSRELVLQENKDGTWLVYALRPGNADVNGSEERIVSGSIKVVDEATKAFLVNLFSILADPGAFRDSAEAP